MNLFEELKRRNVFRVVLAYLVLGWLVLQVADVPATVVNWAGVEVVSIEEWCAYLGELTGLEPKFAESEATVGALPVDLTKMHEQVGGTEVSWKDGIRRLVASLAPELLK